MYSVYCFNPSTGALSWPDGHRSWRKIASFYWRSDAFAFVLAYRGIGLIKLVDGDRCVMYNEFTRKCSSEFRSFLVEDATYLRECCHISDECRESVLNNFKTI